MKKFIFIIFAIVLFLPFNIDAASYGLVNDPDGLNIRSDYTGDSAVLKAIPYNSRVELLSTTIYPDKGTTCPAGWYNVKYDGFVGYSCSSYLNIYEETIGNTNKPYTAKVNCRDYITVWDKTQKWTGNSVMVDKLITGTSITIENTYPGLTDDGCGTSYNWYQIRYGNNKIGYVCSDDVGRIEDLTLNSSEYTESEVTYATSLISAGFKQSYIPYLMRMKRNHPDWDFLPVLTGIKWNDLISGEEGKNKLQAFTTTFLSYYTTYWSGEGDWYWTTKATDAYYLDPRNFLSDRFMFMFESLSYNSEYHTLSALSNFLGSSWLNTDEIKGYFFEAAATHGISPLHLAARIFKEGGSNPNYGPITGTYTGNISGISLFGYYNFYNIGAYTDWAQGLCFAAGHVYSNGECIIAGYTSYGRPWTTIQKGIVGGAEFIGKDYIKVGQDTLYTQKFDIVGDLYTHQYMTNVMAPSQEAESLYDKIVTAGTINKKYTFKIPIYEEMPDYVSLPSIASTNNNLKAIIIDGKLIDNFDTDVIEYIKYVKSDSTSVNITATTSDTYATVTGTGIRELTNVETDLTLIVQAESGDTKTYKIKFIKVEGNKTVEEIISTLSTKVNSNNMYSISPNTDSSSLINSIKKADPASYVEYKNSGGTQIIGSVQIKTGDTLYIKSSSDEEVTYKLVINGDNNGDGNVTILDLLRVQKHILNSSKLTDIYYLAGDTNNDNNVDILDLLRVQKYILGDLKL